MNFLIIPRGLEPSRPAIALLPQHAVLFSSTGKENKPNNKRRGSSIVAEIAAAALRLPAILLPWSLLAKRFTPGKLYFLTRHTCNTWQGWRRDYDSPLGRFSQAPSPCQHHLLTDGRNYREEEPGLERCPVIPHPPEHSMHHPRSFLIKKRCGLGLCNLG